jgi:hypothetical protein
MGGTAMAIWYKIERNIFMVCLVELSFISEAVFFLLQFHETDSPLKLKLFSKSLVKQLLGMIADRKFGEASIFSFISVLVIC